MAQLYEKEGQLTEALLLYIQRFKVGVFVSKEASYLSETFKRLQEALGEVQFRTICQAAYCPFKELLKFITLNTNSLNHRMGERKLADFEVKNSPEPDAKFQKVWQHFLQSVRERLATEGTLNLNETSTEFQQVSQKFGHLGKNSYILPPAQSDDAMTYFVYDRENVLLELVDNDGAGGGG